MRHHHILVCINGAAGCGKSTFVEYCRREAEPFSFMEVHEVSIVDWVKKMARKHFGWDGKRKEPVDRDFLAGLKDLSDNYNGLPFRKVTDFIEQMYNPKTSQICFVHMRQKKDMERLRKWAYDTGQRWIFQILYVERDGTEPVETNEADRDVLETKEMAHTIVYNNLDKEDLVQSAHDFVRDIWKDGISLMFYGKEKAESEDEE